MRFGNIGGVAGRVLLDTRLAVNPFGWVDSQGRPFKALIRRAQCQEWVNFLGSILTGGESEEERVKDIAATLKEAGEARGFRKRKGGGSKSQDVALEKLARRFVAQSQDPARAAELKRKRKEGMAKILFLGGAHLEAEGGEAVDLSDEATRLELLNHEWLDDAKTQPAVIEQKYLQEWDEEAGAFKAALDDDGQPLELPPGIYGFSVGDGILAWLDWETEQLEAFRQGQAEAVSGN